MLVRDVVAQEFDVADAALLPLAVGHAQQLGPVAEHYRLVLLASRHLSQRHQRPSSISFHSPFRFW